MNQASDPAKPTRSLGVVGCIFLVTALYAVSGVCKTPADLWAKHDSPAADVETPASHEGSEHSSEEAKPVPPPLWMVVPFVLILGTIALFPLMHLTMHWWEKNSNKAIVAVVLGGLTLLYYLLIHSHTVDLHFLKHERVEASSAGPSWQLAWTVFQNAVFSEYFPFMALLFALFVVAGGIRIEGDLVARPIVNTAVIAVGGALASFIGTTGAAMLLIRMLLDTNSERRYSVHTVVFFIFVVCNCGGLLLPIGDPPLFLGYLEGVEFLWTLQLWGPWLLANGLILAVYFLLDSLVFYPRETRADVRRDVTTERGIRFAGVWPNALLLILIVVGVALLDPSKPFPGTSWHPWAYLREILLLNVVAVSLLFGSPAPRAANQFSFAAIVEVAALFIGIFVCMQPALQILEVRGSSLGIDTPTKFFWATGSLSSVLDNAPTYLVFLETARSLPQAGEVELMAGVPVRILAGVSLGAVMMGSMTYIGNGPNFMVKTIAESSGVKMPSFFGYMVYSVLVLLPIFYLVTRVFLAE